MASGKSFSTRIRHVSISFSPFSAEQMSAIGTVWLDHALTRIRSATDSTDSPAYILNQTYARRKRAIIAGGLRRAGLSLVTSMKGRGGEVRDWTLTGDTLSTAKVKVASENKVIIGFISGRADAIVTIQRRLCEMWSPSPSDVAAVHAAVRATFSQFRSQFIRVKKSA